jgi:hypothetical protein
VQSTEHKKSDDPGDDPESRTPPTPRAEPFRFLFPSPTRHSALMVSQVRPVSFQGIVRDMVSNNPQRAFTDFDRHYRPERHPGPET